MNKTLFYSLIFLFLAAFWGFVGKVVMDKFTTPQASYIETPAED